MNFSACEIDYAETGYFSKIISDYLNGDPKLKAYYKFAPNEQGLDQAIISRKSFITNRVLLVEQLSLQYAAVNKNELIEKQISSLLSENTFTVCTAHQPNIFTGHLYFIYKILHTIRLSEFLNSKYPDQHFVPVYYMGSEDADLDELGHIYLYGEKYNWNTKQSGAVGRMVVDDELLSLINMMEGRLTVEKYGSELISLVKQSYIKCSTIQDSTFRLLHKLFADLGLVTLLPDNGKLKSIMHSIFEDDLFNNTASAIVEKTVEQLSINYKVQANPRAINLFYLHEDKRERIVKEKTNFRVINSNVVFSETEMRRELQEHPERFSPNVILRGLYQEMILPNIAFIGGGGELSYWVELKTIFENYNVPFPVLILRNSFLLISKLQQQQIEKLGLNSFELFKPVTELNNELVKRQTNNQLQLQKEKEKAESIFSEIKTVASTADVTLAAHCEALLKRLINNLDALEKKMLRAEKKKYEAQIRQLTKLKQQLFPGDSLQERVDNFMPWYAISGKDFISAIYKQSSALEQRFKILVESESTQ